MSEARLLSSYNTNVISNATVQQLLRHIQFNDPVPTVKALGEHAPEVANASADDNAKINAARIALIAWLNDVWMSNESTPLNPMFWYEMHTRLRKVLMLSAYLEGRNLRSFTPPPVLKKSSVPACISQVLRALREAKPAFQQIEERIVGDVDLETFEVYTALAPLQARPAAVQCYGAG